MQVVNTQKQISALVSKAKDSGKRVGFVPTMGALHEGHASLISYALKDCAFVVVSIFVNPTQFNNASDLDKYPRTYNQDIAFLERFGESIAIYAPSAKEVYGNTIASKAYNFGSLEEVMEGEHRPGHFDGVGTVLNHLFRQVEPDNAYFGEKDFQQLVIVQNLVQKENLDINIIGCPIYRQSDGLALSSRNARLTKEQLARAPYIYKVLSEIKGLFNKHSARELKNLVTERFNSTDGLELEYFEMANSKNLHPLSRKRKNQKYRAFIAAYAGDVRLIDNIALN